MRGNRLGDRPLELHCLDRYQRTLSTIIGVGHINLGDST